MVEYHVSDAYQTPWGNTRAQFYNIWSDGVPWFAYDGLFDAWPINTYASKFIQRQAIDTYVTMQVGAYQVSGLQYRVQLRVCLEEGAPAPLALRAYAVIVQDYYPANPSYSRNTFRAATPTNDFVLNPGECWFEERDVTFNSGWTLSNLGVIAWVQVPASAFPAEVHQAAKDMYPFAPLTLAGDLDCDGDVDFGDINPFVLALSNPDAWALMYPDCPALNGDIDGDGVVGFGDINPFVALLSGN